MCYDVLYSTLLPAHHLGCFFFSFSLKMICLSTIPHSLLFLARSLSDRANLQTWLRIPNDTVSMASMQNKSKMLSLFKMEGLRSNASKNKNRIKICYLLLVFKIIVNEAIFKSPIFKKAGLWVSVTTRQIMTFWDCRSGRRTLQNVSIWWVWHPLKWDLWGYKFKWFSIFKNVTSASAWACSVTFQHIDCWLCLSCWHLLCYVWWLNKKLLGLTKKTYTWSACFWWLCPSVHPWVADNLLRRQKLPGPSLWVQ